jgi:hypothetical protein
MKDKFLETMALIVANLTTNAQTMEALRELVATDEEMWATEEYLKFEIEDMRRLISKYQHMIELNK